MSNHERKLVTGVLAAALGAGITVLATTSLPAVLATHKPAHCSLAEPQTEPAPPPRAAIHFHHRSELPAPPPPPAPPASAPVA